MEELDNRRERLTVGETPLLLLLLGLLAALPPVRLAKKDPLLKLVLVLAVVDAADALLLLLPSVLLLTWFWAIGVLVLVNA